MMFYIDLAIALTKALQSNQIAGVDLDVREEEPPAEDDPGFILPNIIVSLTLVQEPKRHTTLCETCGAEFDCGDYG